MENYRYILEPYGGRNTKFDCPACGKKKKYTRYIDTEKEAYLPFEFGRCDSELSCGYHKNPYKEKYEETNRSQVYQKTEPIKIPPRKIANQRPSFHPFSFVQNSMKQYEHNSLVLFLYSKFGPSITKELIKEYLIGTSKKYRKTGNGGVVFWNIDINGKVRNGKIMGYDPSTGNRVKKPYPLQNWVHSVMKLESFNLSHCFYGEHLLKKHPFKDVAIVESEKTAIISSIYLPQYVWLASGNLNGINEQKARALKNRNVHLFPDLSSGGKAYLKWESQASKIKNLTKSISINNLLEKVAPEDHKSQGYDLADYFLSISVEEWANLQKKNSFNFDPVSKVYLNEHGYPASWDYSETPQNRKVTKLERLSKKNRLLNTLIERFDLIEV